jgi:hypothetical protein
MNVLRHDHVSQHDHPITPAHSFKNLQEQITLGVATEKRLTPVTTEREEMQIVPAIEAVEILSHGKE